MIKAMSISDWIRLFFALAITGLLLYYGSELTKQIANLLDIISPVSFQYKILRWIVTLVSVSFLGIALPKKRFIETMFITGCTVGIQILRELISS
jgi:hypothetical protein